MIISSVAMLFWLIFGAFMFALGYREWGILALIVTAVWTAALVIITEIRKVGR